MIRKANLIFLTVLPILTLTFGILHMRTALATTYTGACPNVIGSMNDHECPSGFAPVYTSPDYPSCHSLIAYSSGGGESSTLCCQYLARKVGCGEGEIILPGEEWPVEYYRYTNAEVCDSGGGTGMCGGASGTL